MIPSGRKGLTPLISTFLLIAFAIGLGMLVLSWGSRAAPEQPCSALGIVELDAVPQICVQDSRLTVLIENNGASPVTGIQAVFLSGDSVLTDELTLSLAPGAYERVSFPSPVPSSLQKVRLIPRTGAQSCVEQRVEAEFITAC